MSPALVALLGGVLFSAPDPLASASELAEFVARGGRRPSHLSGQLVDTAEKLLADFEEPEVVRTCVAAAGWVLGYRAAPAEPGWEIVISQPGRRLPSGVTRSTGESILGLIDSSTRSAAVASPFIDHEAAAILGPALAAALARGVDVLLVTQIEEKVPAVRALVAAVPRGVRGALHVHHAEIEQPWPHMKAVVVDEAAAYVGSANLTGNALLGHNLELGVLIRGDLSVLQAIIAGFAEG